MTKFCIICGAKPSTKTAEHVIPQWLLALTGDPKRTINLGFDLSTPGSTPRQRLFAYQAFKFPACKVCNEEFSQLEASAKRIVERLLIGATLSADDICVLLDWLDKVRIGLWLAYCYLDKNVAGISPNFHIKSRMRLEDRFLQIFHTQSSDEGVMFLGVNTPVCQVIPSCFTLRINNIFLFNVSHPFYFARRLGLPYPRVSRLLGDGRTSYDLEGSMERYLLPLIRGTPDHRGSKLFQPIFRRYMEIAPAYYETEYVRRHTDGVNLGIGKLLLETATGFEAYPTSPSSLWTPRTTVETDEFTSQIGIRSLKEQYRLLTQNVTLDELSVEQRRRTKKKISQLKAITDMLLRYMRQGGQ